MDIVDAIRLVEKASSDASRLTGEEAMRINEATALVALEYLKVRDRIMPA